MLILPGIMIPHILSFIAIIDCELLKHTCVYCKGVLANKEKEPLKLLVMYMEKEIIRKTKELF